MDRRGITKSVATCQACAKIHYVGVEVCIGFCMDFSVALIHIFARKPFICQRLPHISSINICNDLKCVMNL